MSNTTKSNEVTVGCPIGAMKYLFDVDGHTHAVCVAKRSDNSGYIGRGICPHYNGKCPALGKWINDWDCYFKKLFG